MSAVIGHNEDPISNPTYLATTIMEICLTTNSLCTGGLMIVMACIQNYSYVSRHHQHLQESRLALSTNQPKPTMKKIFH